MAVGTIYSFELFSLLVKCKEIFVCFFGLGFFGFSFCLFGVFCILEISHAFTASHLPVQVWFQLLYQSWDSYSQLIAFPQKVIEVGASKRPSVS